MKRTAVLILLAVGSAAMGQSWTSDCSWRVLFEAPASTSTIVAVCLESGGELACIANPRVRWRSGEPMRFREAFRDSARLCLQVETGTNDEAALFYVLFDEQNPGDKETPFDEIAGADMPVGCETWKAAQVGAPAQVGHMRHMIRRMGSRSAQTNLPSFHAVATNLPGAERNPGLLARLTGCVVFPRSGEYRMAVGGGETSRFLMVDGKSVVSKDPKTALKLSSWAVGEPVSISAGSHEIEVLAMLEGRDDTIRVGWIEPGMKSVEPLPAEAIVAPRAAVLQRVERAGREVHPGFVTDVMVPYGFSEEDTVLVPVSFRNTTLSRASDRLRYRWDFGDGTGAEGCVLRHVYAGGCVYTASVEVCRDSGPPLIATRTIDCADVSADSVFPVDILMSGVPPVCYPDDKIDGYLRWFGIYPGICDLDFEWDIAMTDGTVAFSNVTVRVSQDNIARLALRVLRENASELKWLSWRAVHCGVTVREERIEFLRRPYSMLPGRAVGDRFYADDGTRLVYVTDPGRSRETGVSDGRVGGGGAVWADDVLGWPGAEFEGRLGPLLPRSNREAGGKPLEYIRLSEQRAVVHTPLARILEVLQATERGNGLVIASLGGYELQDAGDIGFFERRMFFLADVLTQRTGGRAVLVTPPPFTGEEARCREISLAVSRAAISRDLGLADVFSAFKCREAGDDPLFVGEGPVLSAAGREYAAKLILDAVRTVARRK